MASLTPTPTRAPPVRPVKPETVVIDFERPCTHRRGHRWVRQPEGGRYFCAYCLCDGDL